MCKYIDMYMLLMIVSQDQPKHLWRNNVWLESFVLNGFFLKHKDTTSTKVTFASTVVKQKQLKK